MLFVVKLNRPFSYALFYFADTRRCWHGAGTVAQPTVARLDRWLRFDHLTVTPVCAVVSVGGLMKRISTLIGRERIFGQDLTQGDPDQNEAGLRWSHHRGVIVHMSPSELKDV